MSLPGRAVVVVVVALACAAWMPSVLGSATPRAVVSSGLGVHTPLSSFSMSLQFSNPGTIVGYQPFIDLGASSRGCV